MVLRGGGRRLIRTLRLYSMFDVPSRFTRFPYSTHRLTTRVPPPPVLVRHSPLFEPAPRGLPFCTSLSDSRLLPRARSPRGAPCLCTFPPSCPFSLLSHRSEPILTPPCQADNSRMCPLSKFTPPAGYVESGSRRRSQTRRENHGSLACTLDNELAEYQTS